MNTDVEDRLHRDLPGIAHRADGATLELEGVMGRVGQRRRRRAAARGASAVCGLALLVGGLVALTTRGGAGDRSGAEGGPTRTEVPLTRLPQAMVPAGGVGKGDAIGFELSDGNEVVFSVKAWAFFDTYYQSSCRSMSGHTSCWPVPPTEQLEPLPWTRLELAGNNDMVMWIGLPASVDVVELRQGDDVSWQHAIDGVAAFPVATHDPSDEVVAFDAAGLEVLRAAWSTVSLLGESTTVSPDGTSTAPMYFWSSTFATEPGEFVPEVDASTMEGMTQADEDAYRAFADGEMRSCLARDGEAAWNACLVSTDAAVKAYLAERP